MRLAIHEAITREALALVGEDVCRWERRIHGLPVLRQVQRGNVRQDRILPGQLQPERHVDCARFRGAAARLRVLQALIVDRDAELEAGWDRAAARMALQAFGGMLHTVQDMASHSNYVELHVERGTTTPPVWDWRRAPIPSGLEGELVSGTWWLAPRCRAVGDWPEGFGEHEGHGALNKDAPRSSRGRRVVGDRTLFEVARDLALRNSAVEWARLLEQAPNLVRQVRDGAPHTCAREPVDPGVGLARLRDAIRAGEAREAAAWMVALDREHAALVDVLMGGITQLGAGS